MDVVTDFSFFGSKYFDLLLVKEGGTVCNVAREFLVCESLHILNMHYTKLWHSGIIDEAVCS